MIEITTNALKHGTVIAIRGAAHRVEWGLDNRLYLVRASDNVAVATASGQNQLRAKIARLEREAA